MVIRFGSNESGFRLGLHVDDVFLIFTGSFISSIAKIVRLSLLLSDRLNAIVAFKFPHFSIGALRSPVEMRIDAIRMVNLIVLFGINCQVLTLVDENDLISCEVIALNMSIICIGL